MAKIRWCAICLGTAVALSACDSSMLNSASGEYVVVGPAPTQNSAHTGGKL